MGGNEEQWEVTEGNGKQRDAGDVTGSNGRQREMGSHGCQERKWRQRKVGGKWSQQKATGGNRMRREAPAGRRQSRAAGGNSGRREGETAVCNVRQNHMQNNQGCEAGCCVCS